MASDLFSFDRSSFMKSYEAKLEEDSDIDLMQMAKYE